MFGKILFLSVLATVLACLEIEVEGKHGWAEKLPTWYRTTGLPARIFAKLMGGRPLTGYHLFMLPLSVLMLHAPYFLGATNSAPWTVNGELLTLAMSLVFSVMWDYDWFVLNPLYKSKFKKEQVWWHAKTPWVFGLFPLDYLIAPLGSIILVAIASKREVTPSPLLTEHMELLFGVIIYTIILKLAAPFYHRWYAAIRTRDDRDRAGITHQPYQKRES